MQHHQHGKVRLRHCIDRFHKTLTWFLDRRFRNKLHHMITGNRGQWLYKDSSYHWIPYELRHTVNTNKQFLTPTQFVSLNSVVVSVWSFTTHSWEYAKELWTLHTDRNECYCSSKFFHLTTFKPLQYAQTLVLGTKNASVEFVDFHTGDFDSVDVATIFFPEIPSQSVTSIDTLSLLNKQPGAIPLTGNYENHSRAIPNADMAHQAIPGHQISIPPGAIPFTGRSRQCSRAIPKTAKAQQAIPGQDYTTVRPGAIPLTGSKQDSNTSAICPHCNHNSFLCEVSAQKLSRQFRSPVLFQFGIIIYSIFCCTNHVVIWFRRRRKYFRKALFGQLAASALKACNDMTASGMPGRQDLKEFRSLLKSHKRFYRISSPANEHVRASGVVSSRAERRRNYRSCCTSIRSSSSQAFTLDLPPPKRPQRFRPDQPTTFSSRFRNTLRVSKNNDTPSPSPFFSLPIQYRDFYGQIRLELSGSPP